MPFFGSELLETANGELGALPVAEGAFLQLLIQGL